MKIIKVSSLWCPSCIVLDEKLKTINDVEIESLDYDEDETVVKTYNVEILPTLIFVNKKNEELDRLTGEQPLDKIKSLIEKYRNE